VYNYWKSLSYSGHFVYMPPQRKNGMTWLIILILPQYSNVPTRLPDGWQVVSDQSSAVACYGGRAPEVGSEQKQYAVRI
jgi:hypothetical protein